MTSGPDGADAARDRAIVRALCAWFQEHQRELPWREAGQSGRRDPYRSLVSEIMLQQTQVSRVQEKFGPFIERFPTVHALARADIDDVLAMWSGLGYYRRARSLHTAAQEIIERFGEVPGDPGDLESLTGIGRYTAGAIASIVFGHAAPIVDGNVTRVLLRLGGQDLDPKHPATARFCWERAGSLVRVAGRSRAKGVSPGVLNEAMMELGALVCTPRSPDCGRCPVRASCGAFASGRQDEIPRPKAAAAKKTLHMASLLVRDARGRMLIERRPESGLWSGIWQPPTVESATKISRSAVAEHFGVAAGRLSRDDVFLWETTHRSVRIGVYVFEDSPSDLARLEHGREWASPAEIEKRALGTPQRRMLLSDTMSPAGSGAKARKKTMRRRGRGFTLIELLVVIAIIALLIGILLPALSRARRSSQRVVDASNQRQIGIAMAYYAEDNKQFVPREGVSGEEIGDPQEALFPGRAPWAVVLRPYLDDNRKQRYWLDPDMNDLFVGVETYKDPSRPRDRHELHYVVNAFTFEEPGKVDNRGRTVITHRKPSRPLSAIPFPSTAYYLTNLAEDRDESMINDIEANYGATGRTDETAAQLHDIWWMRHVNGQVESNMRIAPEWYDRGPNVLFFDSHVDVVDADVVRDVNSWDDGDYSWFKFIDN